MIETQRRTLLVTTLLLLGLGWFVWAHFKITTDITHFLPSGDEREEAELSREIANSELSRTMILMVGAPDQAASLLASHEFEAKLRADPEITDELAFLEGGPPPGIDQAVWELYHPRRFSFLAPDATSAAVRIGEVGVREVAARLKAKLALPISPLIGRLAPEDPFLTISGLYERFERARNDGIRVVGDRFVTADGHHTVLFLGTIASAFDAQAQAPLLEAIDQAFDAVNAAALSTLTLQQSGINRFAVRSERAIKRDIARVSLVSMIGLVLLFTLLFRSWMLVALTSMPIGIGMLSGCAACLAAFGQIHSLTLAFGAALIGVCIDYTVHLYCHHALAPDPAGPHRTLARIWPGLLLGAATTVTGFVALGWSSFPGLQEVALFASVGISAALAATRWLLPPLLPRTPRPVHLTAAVARWLESTLTAMRRRRFILWLLLAATVALLSIGIPRARWDDDVTELRRLDPQLVAEDEAVRDLVARFEQRRFVIAVAADDESALQINEQVADQLREAQEVGEIGGYRNVYNLLPSARRQRAVEQVARTADDLIPRMRRALEDEGFHPELFAPFEHALTGRSPPPLTFEDLASSALAPMVRSFRISLGDKVAFLTFLHDIRDAPAVASRLAPIAGAKLLDHGGIMARAYEGYRERIVELLFVGLLAIASILAARYRDLRMTLAALLPALLAAGAAVAVLALVGVPLNVLSLTALLMVLSIGVDYGVFLTEAHIQSENIGPTLLSLVVACASTVLGFGLLALSDHPALMSLGLTAGVGVLASLMIAPTVLVLTRPRKQR
ncbi:MAG: MMPL family transporter [Nannocystaceae bacterium]